LNTTIFFWFLFIFETLGISLLLCHKLLLNHLLLFWSKWFIFVTSHTRWYHSWHICLINILFSWIERRYWINSKLLTTRKFSWWCSTTLSRKIHSLTCHKLRNIFLLNPSCLSYHHRFFNTFSSQRFHEMILILFTLRHQSTSYITSIFQQQLLLLMHLLICNQINYFLLCHSFHHGHLFFFWHSHLCKKILNYSLIFKLMLLLSLIYYFHLSL